MTKKPGSILIIQTAFIGDAILVSSMLEAIHGSDPDVPISLLVRKGNEGLYKGHPFLKEVLVLDKKEPWLARMWKMLKVIRARKYDVVVNVQRFLSTGILTVFSGAPLKIGYEKNPLSFLYDKKIPHVISDGRHEVERNASLLGSLFPGQMGEPRLYPSDEAFTKVKRSKPYVCMAPSSVWFTKQWPKEKWISLIQGVQSQYDVLLIGAKSDKELCEEIALSSARGSVFNLCGEYDLLESAALMRNARMNYVNDSAPMHLASSMNAPVTAIYCSTIPAFGFGPRSEQSFVVEIDEELACRPCGLHGHKVCPEGHFKCSDTDPKKIIAQSLSHQNV